MDNNYLRNPGTLKIDLMLRGLRIDPALIKDEVEFSAPAGAGTDLILSGGVLVNVPSGEEFTKDSPYLLKKTGKKSYVINDGETYMPVKVVKPPRFLSMKTTSGVPFSDIATVHGSYVVVRPSPGCDFFNREIECRYCSGDFNRKGYKRQTFTVDEVLETVEAVQKEKVSDIIYFSIGFNEGDDGGIGLLAPYIKAVK